MADPSDDPVILCILLRQSLQLDNPTAIHYAANAVQHILMKYFTLQVLAVKAHLNSLANHLHLKKTTEWLGSNSKKLIISVDEEVWERLKREFNVGKDFFSLKDLETGLTETTLVLWPATYSSVPDYIRLQSNFSQIK